MPAVARACQRMPAQRREHCLARSACQSQPRPFEWASTARSGRGLDKMLETNRVRRTADAKRQAPHDHDIAELEASLREL